MQTRTIRCPRCGCEIVQVCKTTNELLKEIENEKDEWAVDIRADLLEVEDKEAINYDYADLEPLTCSNCDNFELFEDMELYWKENTIPLLKRILDGDKI